MGPEAWAQVHTQTTCPSWVGQVGASLWELCLSVCPSTRLAMGQGAVIPSSTQPCLSLRPSVCPETCSLLWHMSLRHFLLPHSLRSSSQPVQKAWFLFFTEEETEVQREPLSKATMTEWLIQNSSPVWLQSPFTALVSLAPPAGLGWNSKRSGGVRMPEH